ncbi:MAG: OmpA family protein [Chloroflexota bacterium]|nr:OmpA family protein [Chloroflexota bacterium]
MTERTHKDTSTKAEPTPRTTQPEQTPLPVAPSVENILMLQRLIGNQAVGRMMGGALLQRAPHGTRPDAPLPDAIDINATGSYEAVEPDGDNRITVQVNQAGYDFEGWWQKREYRPHTNAEQKQNLRHCRISGTVMATPQSSPDTVTYHYRRYVEGGSWLTQGIMTVHHLGGKVASMKMSEDEWSQGFRQTSQSSRASDEAIAGLPPQVRDVIGASINAPLDSEEERRLANNCASLCRLIDQYLEDSGIGRTARASQINNFIKDITSPFSTEQLPLVKRRARENLFASQHKQGTVTRSYLDWLQIVVMEQPDYTLDIQKNMDLRATGATSTENKYKWNYTVAGYGGDAFIGAGVFAGVITIEKTEPDQWTRNFFMGFAGFSGGLSVGHTVGSATSGSFSTPFPWTSGSFQGPVVLSQVQISASLLDSDILGLGITPVGFLTFYGDGSFAPLAVDASGVFREVGLHAGAELGVSAGYVAGGKDELAAQMQSMSPAKGKSSYQTEQPLHFNVDDPSLTAEGMSEVRKMCAMHLRALESPTSSLQIDGYTSTTGTEKRNQTLSQLRAQNTLQMIRDVLGSRLRIPDNQIGVLGHGETAARNAGSADNVEDAGWRKVLVKLNGQVVLQL